MLKKSTGHYFNKSDCLDRVKIQSIDPDDFTREITDSLTGNLEEDEILFLVFENQSRWKGQIFSAFSCGKFYYLLKKRRKQSKSIKRV